jgi:hypothetical protein
MFPFPSQRSFLIACSPSIDFIGSGIEGYRNSLAGTEKPLQGLAIFRHPGDIRSAAIIISPLSFIFLLFT